jgi:hypothetical protein
MEKTAQNFTAKKRALRRPSGAFALFFRNAATLPIRLLFRFDAKGL